MRLTPLDRLRIYAPRSRILPARVRVRLAGPHWSTISFSADSTRRSSSTFARTVGRGSGCQSLPRTIGRAGSPCSNDTATSRPTSPGLNSTVERAETGRRRGLPGKVIRGAPPSSNPVSVATTTPSIRGGADGAVSNSSAASPWAACVLGAGMVLPSVLQDLLTLQGHGLSGLAEDLAGPFDRDVLSLDHDRAVLVHRNAGGAGRQSD